MNYRKGGPTTQALSFGALSLENHNLLKWIRANLPNPCPLGREDHHPGQEINLPFAQKQMLPLAFKAICYTNILAKVDSTFSHTEMSWRIASQSTFLTGFLSRYLLGLLPHFI
jgi:hypothetical protein